MNRFQRFLVWLADDPWTRVPNFVCFFALCLTIVLYPFMSIPQWNGNLLTWRAVSIVGKSGNHALIDLLLVCTATWFVFKAKPREAFESRKLGVTGLVLVALLPASYHELQWYVTYVLTYGFQWGIIAFTNGWLYLSVAILIGYWYYHGFHLKELALFLVTVGMYIVWYSIGFPITLSFAGGATRYFLSPIVNGIEIASWYFVYLMWFEILRRDKLPQTVIEAIDREMMKQK